MRWMMLGKDKKWHLWFAWYPVYLEDSCEFAWLERVWRATDRSQSDPLRYQYERFTGENRELDPERLVPCRDEIERKKLADPIVLNHEQTNGADVVEAFTKQVLKEGENWEKANQPLSKEVPA